VAPEAAATAELVFDFASTLQWPLSPEAARALYVGILTDTGGFRFANTTPRVLRVAGALLERGVDPESIYESVYASAPEGRVRLTAEVLGTLVVEPERGLAWVTVPPDALQRHHATPTTWTASSSIRDPSRGCGWPSCSPAGERQGEGQLPLARRRGRGGAGASFRRRRTPQGGGGVARGLARRGAGAGARAARQYLNGR